MDQSFDGMVLRSKKKLKACRKETKLEKSPITELPDECLIHILSFLTPKEAGVTSVLSKRWRHLWAYSPSLIFDYPNTRRSFLNGSEELSYVRCVDHVVNSHQVPTIDEFSIRVYFKQDHNERIDSWLKFAMEKSVKRLVLHIPHFPTAYTFPSSLCFTSLSSIKLSSVDVTGEVLEKLIKNCHTLESMSVSYSRGKLVHLKVAGPSLNLKHLEIISCIQLKNLEVSAPNLVSFCYYGKSLSLHLERFSKLAKVAIGGDFTSCLASNSLDLWKCISEIEVLTVETVPSGFLTTKANVFPVFSRLKMLVLNIFPCSDVELFGVVRLIQAFPSIHKFVLGLRIFAKVLRTERTRKVKVYPHDNLKCVEILQFTGSELEMAFARYLMKSAVSLKKLIIEPSFCKLVEARARKQASKLFSYLKFGAELQIRDPQHRNFFGS